MREQHRVGCLNDMRPIGRELWTKCRLGRPRYSDDDAGDGGGERQTARARREHADWSERDWRGLILSGDRRPRREPGFLGCCREASLAHPSPEHHEGGRQQCKQDDRRRNAIFDGASRRGEYPEQHEVVHEVRDHSDEKPEVDEQHRPEAGVDEDLHASRVGRP